MTIKTIPVERKILKQEAVRPLDLSTPKFYVVTQDNFDEFKKKYIEENKDFVLYVMTPGSYKKLVRNNIELQRYIQQQKAVIVYYESLI